MIYWTIYCILDGINEAHFYHFKDVNKLTKINEHVFKLITRILVALFLFDNNLLNLACFALAQPFLMNNTYYITRHLLDRKVYSISLLNQSKNSTAKTTKIFTPINRIILFLTSLILWNLI